MVSTPLMLWAVGAVVHESLEVTVVATALSWVVLFVIVEGLVRGRLLAVIVLLALAAVAVIVLWWFLLG